MAGSATKRGEKMKAVGGEVAKRRIILHIVLNFALPCHNLSCRHMNIAIKSFFYCAHCFDILSKVHVNGTLMQRKETLFLSLNLLYELWLHVWAKGQDYILVSIQKSRLFVTLLCQYLDNCACVICLGQFMMHTIIQMMMQIMMRRKTLECSQ